MTIEITCECGKRLRTKDEHAGKRVKCPACGRPLLLPQAAEVDHPVGRRAPSALLGMKKKQKTPSGTLVAPCRFVFAGTGGSLFGELIVGSILTIITFGLYSPWFICRLTAWSTQHTALQDSEDNTVSVDFVGTGGDLFVIYIFGYALTMITFGIYSFWFAVKLTKFFMENTTGETPDGDEIELSFEGTGGELFGQLFVGVVLTVITFGIYSPWMLCDLHRFFYDNTHIYVGDDEALSIAFVGTGGELFVMFLIGYVLSILTLGIYSFWFHVNLLKFFQGNTELNSAAGNTYRMEFTGTGGEYAMINILGVVLTIITLGIYYFWFVVDLMKFQTNHTAVFEAAEAD